MPEFDPVETIESQERIIKKQNREIKKLERDLVEAQNEFFNYKKEQKLKIMEIQKKFKEQSHTIKNFKMKKKLEARQFEERQIEHKEKDATMGSKIKGLLDEISVMKIENEELMNKLAQNNITIMERNNELSDLKTQLKQLQDKLEHIKQTELDALQNKLKVKEDLLEKQNQAINQLTLDMKKHEVEIAELEFRLSNEQAKQGEAIDLRNKVTSQEELILHLRKTNVSNEERIKTLREQINGSNRRINELLQKLKSGQGHPQPDQAITYYQITFPEED